MSDPDSSATDHSRPGDGPRPDYDDPGALFNEFLLAGFLPFCLLYLASFLALVALVPEYAAPIRIERTAGRATVTDGVLRWVLPFLVATVLLAPYLGLYARWLRPRFSERGWV